MTERLDSAVREHVERVLAAHDWRKKEAAQALGIGRTTLYRLMEKWKKQDRGGKQRES